MVKPLLPFLFALLLVGCNRGLDTKEAVRQGVIDYLSARSNLNMSSMNVDVVSVAFRGDEADATVSIRPKGGDAAAGMAMRYTLEKKGNRWVVKGKGSGHAGAESGMGSGGAGGTMPPGHPAVPSEPKPAPGDQKK